jgi:hypothetical protein
MAKTIKTRIQYKYDTQANWQNCDKDSLKGELYVHTTDTNITQVAIGDGTKKVKDLPYVMTGTPLSVIKTVPSVVTELTYNGALQGPAWNDLDPNELTVSGDISGTTAGTYTAKFTPKDGYIWSDGTNKPKSVTWRINKKTPSYTSDNKITINKQDVAIASFSIEHFNEITFNYMSTTFTGAIQATVDLTVNAGIFYITATLSADSPSGSGICTITIPETTNYTAIEIPIEFICKALDDYTWEEISAISAEGKGANYFSIGDTKKITINGTVGTETFNNFETYVYIIGFDHNSSTEGTGITFGTFKSADGTNIALVDSYYKKIYSKGTKYFNMNHWGEAAHGGWPGCDLRYDILGSTNLSPSGYGSTAGSNRTGYNATTTCTTNPISNTLMAALPAELRSHMKPITKYTSYSSGTWSASTKTTASKDYLPLLSEFEVTGSTTAGGLSDESNYQEQYEYYSKGNSKIKSNQALTESITWWLRSGKKATILLTKGPTNFVYINTSGTSTSESSQVSQGLAPIFLV